MTNRGMAAGLFATMLALGISAKAYAAPAYVINEIEVTDSAGFKTYADRQGALIQMFGGRFLARGGATETIAGPKADQRITIYVFDSMDKLRAWQNAPQQTDLAALRDHSSHFRSFAVEGLPN